MPGINQVNKQNYIQLFFEDLNNSLSEEFIENYFYRNYNSVETVKFLTKTGGASEIKIININFTERQECFKASEDIPNKEEFLNINNFM